MKSPIKTRRIITIDVKGVAFVGDLRNFEPIIPGPKHTPYGKIDFLLGKVPNNPKSLERSLTFGKKLGFEDNPTALKAALKDGFRAPSTEVYFRTNYAGDASVTIKFIITGPNGVSSRITTGWTLKQGKAYLNTAY